MSSIQTAHDLNRLRRCLVCNRQISSQMRRATRKDRRARDLRNEPIYLSLMQEHEPRFLLSDRRLPTILCHLCGYSLISAATAKKHKFPDRLQEMRERFPFDNDERFRCHGSNVSCLICQLTFLPTLTNRISGRSTEEKEAKSSAFSSSCSSRDSVPRPIVAAPTPSRSGRGQKRTRKFVQAVRTVRARNYLPGKYFITLSCVLLPQSRQR